MVLGQAESENAHMGTVAMADGYANNGVGGSGSFNANYIHPGTKASADVVFHCE